MGIVNKWENYGKWRHGKKRKELLENKAMSNEQIIDEVYNKYTTKFMGYDDIPSKELFLFEIKNNPEFSEIWGLKVEERELSLEERTQYKKKRDGIARTFAPYTHQMLDGSNIPTKLITLTYNNEKIESYE